jgi:hypothetical protein
MAAARLRFFDKKRRKCHLRENFVTSPSVCGARAKGQHCQQALQARPSRAAVQGQLVGYLRHFPMLAADSNSLMALLSSPPCHAAPTAARQLHRGAVNNNNDGRAPTQPTGGGGRLPASRQI